MNTVDEMTHDAAAELLPWLANDSLPDDEKGQEPSQPIVRQKEAEVSEPLVPPGAGHLGVEAVGQPRPVVGVAPGKVRAHQDHEGNQPDDDPSRRHGTVGCAAISRQRRPDPPHRRQHGRSPGEHRLRSGRKTRPLLR